MDLSSFKSPCRILSNVLAYAAPIWRCLFCILALHSWLAGYHVNFSGLLLDLRPRELSQRLGNGRAIHLGGFSPDLATILDPVRLIFLDLGILGPTYYLNCSLARTDVFC